MKNSEYGEELNGRISYVIGRVEAKYVRERYVRVAAIMIAIAEGSKNNCVKETHNKSVASTISSTRKDVPS